MNLINRRSAIAATLGTLAASTRAQSDLPSRPITLVVGFAPGGPNDLVARQLALRLSDQLKQQVIVENRPGANGNIAAMHVARAQADGSTLLYNIPPTVFWNSVRTWMEPEDLPSMLLKAVVFGLMIAVIACGWGLTTKGGPKEVGTSTTGAVVMILVTVALMDALLTKLLFA
jgi:hypothetical protein